MAPLVAHGTSKPPYSCPWHTIIATGQLCIPFRPRSFFANMTISSGKTYMEAVSSLKIPAMSRDCTLMMSQASSPDEAALVVAAKVFGFFFHGRTTTAITVREPVEDCTPGIGADQDAKYEILAVLEFNSTRKRQSVIVRQPDGSILLQCKVLHLYRFLLAAVGLALAYVHSLVALLISDPGLKNEQPQDCFSTYHLLPE